MKAKLQIFLIAALMCLGVVGCDTKEPEKPKVEEEKIVWESETIKPQFGVTRSEYNSTTLQNITYYLDADVISDEQRDIFINNVTKYFEMMPGELKEENALTVYVGEDVTTVCSEKEMYISVADMDYPETYFKMFIAAHPEDINMGHAYAFSVKAYGELGLKEITRPHDDESIATFFANSENSYLLDFSLPMFEEKYFEKETAEYVQSAACAFVDYCIETHGEKETKEMCLNTGAEARQKLVEYKNQWLEEIGVTTSYEEFGKVNFRYNCEAKGKLEKYPDIFVSEYPYVIHRESINWYFSDADIKELGYCQLIEKYWEIADVAELDCADTREVLSDYIAEEIPAVDLFTVLHVDEKLNGKISVASLYYPSLESIVCFIDFQQIKYSLVHEYIHYLTVGADKIFYPANGLVEGATEEIATVQCENRLKKMFYAQWEYTEDELESMREMGFYNDEEGVLVSKINYNKANNFYEEMKGAEDADISTKIFNISGAGLLEEGGYTVGASMSEYLIELYGMDVFMNHCTTYGSIEKMCGKPFREMYEEWALWNKEKLLD